MPTASASVAGHISGNSLPTAPDVRELEKERHQKMML
jgi:hypothetical protein